MNTTSKLFLLIAWILAGTAGIAAGAEPTTTVETAATVVPFTPVLAMRDCSFPDVERTARCGTLTVAEDPEHPEGRKIDLNLVVLPATSGTPRRDAVAYLVGGPGQAATSMVKFFGDSLRGIQEHHDLVLVDQRGTGRSNPLDCDLTPDELARAIFAGSAPASRLAACRDGLDADPALYTTPIAMDDLEAVRAGLDYERFHLIGISYGSRAALVYARRHPERVASLVLRGVSSPADNIPRTWLRSGEASMTALLDRCASDPACRKAYPNLRQQLEGILSDLADRPVRVTASRGGDPPVGLEVTPEIFMGALQLALYSDRGAARIPALVDRAAHGDFEPFAQGVVGAFLRTGESMYLGLYLSVLCAEDVPFLDPAAVDQEEPWSFRRPGMLANLVETCRGWPSGTLPEGYKQPVTSTVPALLLSGSTDPATSPRGAEEVARHLPNSRHLITPGLGHHPSWTSCFANLAASLINGAPIQQLDVACVEEERTSDFYVPVARWVWLLLGGVGIGLVVLALRRWRGRSR